MARTAVVTGAGSGIGRAVAAAFAQAGDRVVVCDISQERLDAVVAELGPSASGSVVDVSDADALERFIRDAASGGTLDVLVNNAAIFDGYAGVTETDAHLWDRVIAINLTGAFHGCRVAADIMIPQGRGRIVNIGSVGSFRGGADGLAYVTAKHGLVGLTRRLAVDVGPHGVTANVICPGSITTNVRENSAEIMGVAPEQMQHGVSAEFSQELLDWMIPARRKGTPEEVAALVAFVASDAAGYVNGEAIAIDGGMLAV